MKPRRPYLLRALYEWIVDCDEVPNILVDTEVAGVVVPTEYVQDGQIVLNISPSAVRDLSLGNEFVMCPGVSQGGVLKLRCRSKAFVRFIVVTVDRVLRLRTKTLRRRVPSNRAGNVGTQSRSSSRGNCGEGWRR